MITLQFSGVRLSLVDVELDTAVVFLGDELAHLGIPCGLETGAGDGCRQYVGDPNPLFVQFASDLQVASTGWW